MVQHFKAFAESVMAAHPRAPDPFVVEIGSNDGILLQHVAQAGIRHLGVEPSANVARVAIAKGVRTLCAFFNDDLARHIVQEHGQADAILAANVMSHIPIPNSVAAGIRRLLKPDGVFLFEAPSLINVMEQTSYDQIYDEHLFYFSVTSISRLCERHGLELVDLLPQDVHGGSVRYVITHAGKWAVSAAVRMACAREAQMKLGEAEPYEEFRQRIEASRRDLVALLYNLKRQGKRVIGYGATAKSTTVTNFCGITTELVEFITDSTPAKQGKVNPGMHIPIRPREAFEARYPDYALLFAWNHGAEIMAKEQAFQRSGGKWILYVPTVRIVDGMEAAAARASAAVGA